MFEDRIADLSDSITLFESLLDSHKANRARLIEKRRGAADHIMVEIDDRLAANARAIECLSRSIECFRAQLNSLESHSPVSGSPFSKTATNAET